jgi:DNA-binding transcriptional regulator YiaG
MQSYPLETKKKLEEEIHLQWQTPSPERIKELRCKTQSTPEELGILMGLSPKHIPKWESGDWFPKPSETNFLRILAEKPEMIDWLKSQQN